MAIIEKETNLEKNVTMADGYICGTGLRQYYKVRFENGAERWLRSWKEYPVGAMVSANMRWGYDTGTVLERTTAKPEGLRNRQIPKIRYAELLEKEGKRVHVLIVRPGMVPEEASIYADPDSLMEMLGNTGEAKISKSVKIINGDKDGNIMNRVVYQEGWKIGAIVSGTFIVAGDDAGKTVSLTDEQIAKYAEAFRVPDVFSNAAFNAKVAEYYGPAPDCDYCDGDDYDGEEDDLY